MKYYLFRITDGSTVEEVQRELEKKGLKDCFVIEDDSVGEIFIGGHSRKSLKSTKAILVEEKEAQVDWNEQWSLFAENFNDGKAHIAVGDQTLLLLPGAGFGDLSHPTTYLMLEMMKGYVANEKIVDIGTGSGILSLAALLLGAKSALGIDIDAAALKHAKENAKINGLKATFCKTLPKKMGTENVLLMNMIFPEQKEFGPEQLNPLAKLWIISGVLEEQKRAYLAQAKQWGWEPIAVHQKSEWLGWIFKVL